jgi:hypothetical protein
MPVLPSNTITFVTILFSLIWLPSSKLCAQDLSTLIQGAHFGAVNKPQTAFSQEQSESLLKAFLFFDRGSQLLSTYKEPQVTRGAKGPQFFETCRPLSLLL